jgi:aspartokinase/homoserine dehydrogenase 1
MKGLLVLKFGGTSLGDAAAIARVIEIVREHRSAAPVVTVVSAMAKVTDRLLALGRASLRRDAAAIGSDVDALRRQHLETFLALADGPRYRAAIAECVERSFVEVQALLDGIRLLGEFSDRTSDKLLAFGEILSSNLLARALAARDPRFCHSDARDWIVSESTRQGPVVDFPETERRIRKRLRPLLVRGQSPVVPGFICRNAAGEVATLGRNGSDYSAAIVGAALRAREIWIYTDVDGVMTADPNLVAEAAVLPQISYQEAAEMSYFGAKVIYPKTIIPAVSHRIPIRIKNTFNPAAAGTLIVEKGSLRPVVKTVTSVRNLALLNVQGNGMVGIPGVAARLFDALAAEGINILMVSQSSSEHSICLVLQAGDAPGAVRAIERQFQLEIERQLIERVQVTGGVATVSIIGTGMRGTPGISWKFFEALGKHRINVLAIAQGSSELNISASILERDYRQAVQAIHTAFGLTRDLHVFVFGCGNIGRMLLRQIHENRRSIARTLAVELKVLGVANSRQWLFAATGLSGKALQALGRGEALETVEGASARPPTEEIFDRIAATYRSDVVLVDATGAEMAPTHIEGLRRGYHVVTANKKPVTARLSEYQEIQRLKRRKGLGYQYEATFGAGLPLLYTLQDLLQTGDQVLHIQGCLSGTLGFLCSRLDEGVPFSTALREAMKLGYTEPDPRDDLSGLDVARKALILARTIGRQVNLDEIVIENLVPEPLRGVDVAEFLERLPELDASWASRADAARAAGTSLKYVATIPSGGPVAVGVREVASDGLLGALQGPENIVVMRTARYDAHPVTIVGPGAGPAVTAAGMTTDMLVLGTLLTRRG